MTTTEDAGVKCKGCGFQEPKNYVWDCNRCGGEVCADCSDDGRNCRDCEMAVFSGEDDE